MTTDPGFGHQDVLRTTRNLLQPAAMPQATPQERPYAVVRRYRTEIAASTSSVFSTLAAFPLDSVKTRMQTYQYKGFLDCVGHTYRTEKLGGFFRGMHKPRPQPRILVKSLVIDNWSFFRRHGSHG
jgi:hypothetical protein